MNLLANLINDLMIVVPQIVIMKVYRLEKYFRKVPPSELDS